MFNILYRKFLDVLDSRTFLEILIFISRVLLAFVLFFFLVDVHTFFNLVAMGLKWQDFMIVKIIFSLFVVFGAKLWYSLITYIMHSFTEYLAETFFIRTDDPKLSLFHWIPTAELIDYMFECETFSRKDIEDHFGISRTTFDTMVKKMDSVWLFTRGPNNSRVLNRDFSRSDIYTMLSSGDVKRVHREIWNGKYTYSPSMPDILSRGGFTTRPLNNQNALQ